MSFLDSLESNLKSLEARDEAASSSARDQRRREIDHAQLLAASENAARLKTSPYTSELLKQVTRIGYSLRVKVRMAWLGSTLRFEARDSKLELRPSAKGIMVAFIESGRETRLQPLDLDSDPAALAQEWLGQK